MQDEPERTDHCTVVIPAHDEEDTVAGVVGEFRRTLEEAGITCEILVIDDGSSDRTAALARAAGARVLRRQANRGYGASIKTGIRRAKHGVIIIADADGTYPPESLPKLLAGLKDNDMVVGARTGPNVHIPLVRRPAKWLLGKLANYVGGMRIPDLNSGLRAFRKTDVTPFFQMLPLGFSLTTTLTLAMLTNGMDVSFVPIDYRKRKGRSKIHPVRDTVNFFALVLRTALFFRPMRVFFPLALVGSGISIGKLIYDAYTYNFSVKGTTVAALMLTAQIWLLGLVADLVVAQRRIR